MKKLWLAVILLLSVSAQASDWPTGKAYGYNCVKNVGSCNVIIEDLITQPKLFIGKSSFNGKNEVINIAYKGKYQPTIMAGVWGESWAVDTNYDTIYYCQMGTCENLQWRDYFDNMIYAPGVDTGSNAGGDQIILLDPKTKELGYPVNGGMYSQYRHSYDISHLLQTNNLENLKQGLVEGANGKWLKELQADVFIYRQSNGDESYQGFANPLNWFYPTIIPLIEAHIVLQRNNMYTKEEFNLVHKWLEKRVWALEQGPMDGTIGDSQNWQLTHQAGNHETDQKKVAYMLWGIADNNETYFTAGVNGFEDFYSTMRSNGTFKGEHKKGNNSGSINYGISSGNEVGQAMIVMAIILHNQGIDVRKNYPKIEKFVQWASKNYSDLSKTGYNTSGSVSNNSLQFMSDDPQEKNTLGWMFLWDQVFETNYSKDFDVYEKVKSLITFGVVSPENIIIN